MIRAIIDGSLRDRFQVILATLIIVAASTPVRPRRSSRTR